MQKKILTLLLIVLTVYSLYQCTGGDASADVRGKAYAGAATCVRCHRRVADSYVHAAHNKTSANRIDSLVQELSKGTADSFAFPNETVYVTRKNDGYYQSSMQGGKMVQSRRFDVVFGAGRHAYTFASRKDDALSELPLSYFHAAAGWANSPGFPADKAYFDRPIVSRCFECHGSYVAREFVQTGSVSEREKIDPATIIYGIDCERCHGPAAMHVQFHTDNPQIKEAKYITRWTSLSRQQKLDACAVCHSGNDMAMQRSTFGFAPGDTLANYYVPFVGATNTVDVHGKQTQLLMASACFRNTKTLECATCHDPHQPQLNTIAQFSQTCMNCHPAGSDHFCKETSLPTAVLATDCINCHMPLQASKAITYRKAGALQTTPYYLRTHRIGVYR
jgi:hypothetical protein